MAIENIQYKHDHTILYRAFRPVNNHFISGYKKNNRKRQQKNSNKTFEKTLSKPESHIWPLKIC